jgi:carboxypeptidase C (cathepsin A)
MKLECRLAVPGSLCFLIALAFACAVPVLRAQDRPPAPAPAAAAEHNAADKKDDKDTPIPPEKSVVTHHELALGGKTLKYTATAGTLLIRDEEDKPYGSIFCVA